MNGDGTDAENSTQAAPRWMLAIGGGLAAAACSLVFALWGVNGPTYLFDLIAAYCG